MRAAVLSERLLALAPRNAAQLLDFLVAPGEDPVGGRREALTALADLLAAESLPYETVAEIYRTARENGMDELAAVLLGGGGAHGRPKKEPEPKQIQPGGRKLTLGERRALARTPDKNLLDRLAADADPRVIEVVLENRRLVEAQVIKMATRRPARPDVLEVIARHKRWVTRPFVRRALVLNPYTPVPISLRLLALLNLPDLKDVTSAADLPEGVLQAAGKLLDKKRSVLRGDKP